jgi:ribosomal-protein-alanine N-acetyltransferase
MQNPEAVLDTFPLLVTDRLELIELKQAHLTDIFDLFGDNRVTRYYNLLPLKEESECQKIIDWYSKRFKEKLAIRWGIALKGETSIIGTIGFNNFKEDHRANIGYDLKFSFWNNGYITEALSAVLSFGFEKLLINRIEAEVMPGNTASEKVLLKAGFKNEGVLRDWMQWNDRHYDMLMFSILKREYFQIE